nr:hypothetical protein [Xanthomonas campestris]
MLIASWVVAVVFTPYLGVKLLLDLKKIEGCHAAMYDTPRYRLVAGQSGFWWRRMQALGHRGCFSLCPAFAGIGILITHTCTSGMIEHQRTPWITRSLATQQSEMIPIRLSPRPDAGSRPARQLRPRRTDSVPTCDSPTRRRPHAPERNGLTAPYRAAKHAFLACTSLI